MKLKFDKELLLEKTSKALMFIPKATLIPVLDNFLFKVTGNELEITANNTETQVKITTQVLESAHNGSFCIPARLLVSTLKLLRNPEVTIEVKKKEQAILCVIRSGNSKYQLSSEPTESFVEMIAPHAPFEATFDANTLKDALHRAEKFTLEEDDLARVQFTGIEIVNSDSEMILTSTDAITLSRQRLKPRAIGRWESIIISTRVSSAIREMSNDKQIIDLMHDGKKIIIHGGWFVITAVLIDGKYPQTSQFFAELPENRIRLTTFEYRDALERLSLYCSKETGYVMEMVMSADRLLMSTEDIGRNNEGHEIIELECKAPTSIGVNMKFMLNILSCIEPDSIHVYYTNEKQALYVIPNIDVPMEIYMVQPTWVARKQPVKKEAV